MKATRNFPALAVSNKAERSVKAGHPWVYDAEILSPADEDALENGALVDVLSKSGAYLGTGFYSRQSKIRVRILSSNPNETFEKPFFERRIRYALDYRAVVMPGDDFSCCRLIFGEADGLPGLTVDRFSDILVTQVLSYGTDCRKEMLYHLLADELQRRGAPVRGIYERNEAALRDLEGLPRVKGWYEGMSHPQKTSVDILENGIRYAVDFENGQKTGFFLDQKYNRAAVGRISAGRTVLDCFTHTGSFALNAAWGGAAHVTAVDVSQTAVDCARKNAEANGLAERMDFLTADVFDLLPALAEEKKRRYDLIILDPPAFTKSRKNVASAERGYKEINYRAMKLLPRGGYLATCSCSHFMREDLFEKMLKSASFDAAVSLKLVEARRQAPDHPILWNVPETDYLKFYIFQVV